MPAALGRMILAEGDVAQFVDDAVSFGAEDREDSAQWSILRVGRPPKRASDERKLTLGLSSSARMKSGRIPAPAAQVGGAHLPR
jgi:hypothetical protein